MLRRQFLASTALIPLGACGGISFPAIVSTVDPALGKAIGYIDAISTGLTDLLPRLQKLIPSAAELASIEKWIGIVVDGGKQIASVSSLSGGASVAQTILSAVGSILNTVGIALPPPYNLIIPAVTAVLPGIATIFGIPMPSMTRHVAASVISPDAGVAMLRDIHARPR
jgi:hypothetical protein